MREVYHARAPRIDGNRANRYRSSDMRQTIFAIAIIALSIVLTGCILLQQRGSGLGAAFGGEGNVFRTKRGLEKGLFYVTTALSALFLATAVLNLVLA